MPTSSQAGALFAGGASRRMGTDKALLLFRGRPFWEIQTSLLRSLERSPLLVVAGTPPPWMPPDFEFVEDAPDFPGCGPLSGFAALGERLSSGNCLTLGIDYPLLPENWIREQLARFPTDCGWIPDVSGRLLPFVASYPATLLREATTRLEQGQNRVLSWIEPGVQSHKVATIKIPPDAAEAFANVNQPEDFQRLQYYHESSS